jgi:hypothetical protein
MSDITQLIRNNRHINIPLTGGMNNINGRYWLSMPSIIFALTEIRARSGTFANPWQSGKSEVCAPPPFTTIPDRLSDLLDQRAVELYAIAKSQNKRVLIMWSGGIDSTVVVSSFIKNLSVADLDNVSILLTMNSITENPDFYQSHISGRIHCMPYLDYVVNKENLNKYMLLHGDPADCLFGPSTAMFADLIPTGDHLKPFKDNVNLIAKSIDRKSLKVIKQHRVEGFGNWYANKITNNLLEVAPPGVDTISDWWWWHYYNFKWEFSIWRYVFRRKCGGYEKEPLSESDIKQIVDHTYFNTPKFQQWSYTNLKNHIQTDLKSHKLQARQYIYELDHNQLYFNRKTKFESVPTYNQGSLLRLNKPFLWSHDWTGHYPDEPYLKLACINMLESYKG